jgi:hypothetical protein
MVAAHQGDGSIVKQLLAVGADINIGKEVILIIVVVDANVRVVVSILLYVLI